MDVRDYMRERYAPPPGNSDPDAFICPNSSCDDSSGHFKIWVGEGYARGYCVKCAWPEKGRRDLYQIIADLEGITRAEVLQKFGLTRGPKDFLDNRFRSDAPTDLNAAMESLEAPVEKTTRPKAKPKKVPAKVEKLAPNPEVRPPVYGPIKPDPEHLALWRGWFPSLLKPPTFMGSDIMEYLQQRKPAGWITPEIIKRYHIRYAEAGYGTSNYLGYKFHGRVMLPVFSEGKLVFCQGRAAFPDQEPKYDSPWIAGPEQLKDPKWLNHRDKGKNFLWRPAGDAFFGADRAVGSKTLIIVEGILDAIRLGNGALSLLGKGLTDRRLGVLTSLKERGAREVILWLDNDVTPDERNKVLSRVTRVLPCRWTTSRFKKAKDAAEMTDEQIARTLDRAEELPFLEELLGED